MVQRSNAAKACKQISKKAALYIRVSTDAQYEEGYSVDAQKEMLEAYCKSRGICNYEFFIDGGFSGSNIERPEIKRLTEEVHQGLISHVVVYKLDRLSRSQKDTLYLIEDVFNPNETNFISLNENMDTSTPIGRAMLGIMSAFAQLERETIRERTRMGMKERVKNGLWMGGGKIPFGYDYDRNQGILVPNSDADTVRNIYDLYLKGHACNEIAKIVGLKYERLAVQILKRKSNAGFIHYKGQEYIGRHKPIISQEIYNRAMDRMQSRSNKKLGASNYLLTGLVYCGKCGAKMRYQKWGNGGSKLWCYSQDKSKPHLTKDPECDNDKVWASEVEKAVIDNLFAVSLKSRPESDEPEDMGIVKLLQRQYKQCANKLKRLYGLYASDTSGSEDGIWQESIEELKKELSRLHTQINTEKAREETSRRKGHIRDTIENLSEIWDHLTEQEKQNIIRECVDKVVITFGKVQIYYRFENI